MIFMAFDGLGKAFLLGSFNSFGEARESLLCDESAVLFQFSGKVTLVCLPSSVQLVVTRKEYSERQKLLWEERNSKLMKEEKEAQDSKEFAEYKRLKEKFEKEKS